MLGDQTGLGGIREPTEKQNCSGAPITRMWSLILQRAAGEAAMDPPVSYDLSITSV